MDAGFHGRQRTGTLPVQATEKSDDESEYHFYLGDIYARFIKPFDNILKTQAEVVYVFSWLRLKMPLTVLIK